MARPVLVFQPVDFTPIVRDAVKFPKRASGDPMKFILQPWHVAFVLVSGWVNRRQQQVAAMPNDQIEALLEQLGKKRVPLTYGQRQRDLNNTHATV